MPRANGSREQSRKKKEDAEKRPTGGSPILKWGSWMGCTEGGTKGKDFLGIFIQQLKMHKAYGRLFVPLCGKKLAHLVICSKRE